MVTSSTPTPTPAMKRQRSMPNTEFWHAMMTVKIEYQSSAQVNTLRRPNRSAT